MDIGLARSSGEQPYIAILELLIIAICVATWGHQWQRRRVCFNSDTEGAVFSVNPVFGNTALSCAFCVRYTTRRPAVDSA